MKKFFIDEKEKIKQNKNLRLVSYLIPLKCEKQGIIASLPANVRIQQDAPSHADGQYFPNDDNNDDDSLSLISFKSKISKFQTKNKNFHQSNIDQY